MAADIAAIPGVAAIETRVVANVTLDLAAARRARHGPARLDSRPTRRPLVNDLFLRRGRWIEPGRPDEVLASEGFVVAHGLEPGDRMPAVINGRLRRLTIVGVALSPEYIYSIRPGELVPDDRRFGIFWMDQRALAAAFDMEGGFNDVVLGAVARRVADEAIIARSIGSSSPTAGSARFRARCSCRTGRSRTSSRSCRASASCCRSIFLLVAAFILNVALTRALALQRPQIAALKALGYANTAHRLALPEVGAGHRRSSASSSASPCGAWLGHADHRALQRSSSAFPSCSSASRSGVVVGATALTLAAAAGGAFGAVRRAVRVPPAEAMRPEAPARYRRSVLETPFVASHLGTAGRMVLRNLDAPSGARRGLGVRHRLRRRRS